MAKGGMQEYVEGGWGSINETLKEPGPEDRAKRNRALQEQYEMDAAYLRCFTSPEGQVVLEDLKQRYVFKNSYNPGLVNPDQHGHFFEGHRDMVLMFMKTMERARSGSPIQPEIDLT